MHAVELVVAIGWAAFWIYRLAAVFSTKRGRIPWSRELRIRAVIAGELAGAGRARTPAELDAYGREHWTPWRTWACVAVRAPGPALLTAPESYGTNRARALTRAPESHHPPLSDASA